MTLILGIKCSAGIVMGSDGAATLISAEGIPTVMEPMHKLHVLQESLIMGVSGQVGLGQLYCDRVASLWKANQFGKECSMPDALRKLRQAIGQDAQPSIAMASVAAPLMGGFARQQILTKSLIAVPVGGFSGQPELIQCDYTGMAEAATSDLPYISIGSGQSLADPFLAFLRRIFWPGTLPTVVDGIFAVTWTLLQAIAATPGGVSEPIQLAVLEGGRGQKPSARILTEQETQEHRESVLDAEVNLRRLKDYPQGVVETPPAAPSSTA